VVWRALSSGIDAETNGERILLRVGGDAATRFFDVGANVGAWTSLCLQHASSTAEIVAFEPGLSALERLRQLHGANPRVEIVAKSVGEEENIVTFFEEPGAGETSSLVAGFSRVGAVERKVEMTTVDAELERRAWDGLDFLKIDTEGYDFFVLVGATSALSEQRIGIVQFEYNAPWAVAGSTLRAALDLLKRYGYQVFLLKHDGLHTVRYEKFGEYFAYSNYVALCPRVIPAFKNCIHAF